LTRAARSAAHALSTLTGSAQQVPRSRSTCTILANR
jgi:hypothetical protein